MNFAAGWKFWAATTALTRGASFTGTDQWQEEIGMQMLRKLLPVIILIAGLVGAVSSHTAETKRRSVILTTTSSTQDSGLLDVLVPLFEKRSGYSVKTISVGTGQSLALAAKGDADVALVHAPSLERKYVADGKLKNRRLVMYNDFVIIGPKDDPANIASLRSAVAAMKAIERAKAPFVSRGDNSGTHNLEKSLWKTAGIQPQGSWYIDSGQGMAATLAIAHERSAYTLTDRGTYLALQTRVTLPILVQGDRTLLNIYSVIEVNPANGPRVNAAGGKAFADFMVSSEAQNLIKSFGGDKFGQPLFVPVAHRQEEELGA
jgi:tungstate transport system substrate-binding protein